MKIGIIDADLLDNGTRHPNLALMKLSGYYKSIGYEVSLLENYNDTNSYDKIYISKVFTFTKVPSSVYLLENVVLGGTGFFEDGGEALPNVIEHHKPDYDLYKTYIENRIKEGKKKGRYVDYEKYSIGFTSRGCFRKCEFCVNKKYDRAIRHSPVSEFLDKEKPYIYLWDDNILAFSGWKDILDELEATGKPFQFRQGLDIRLMNDEKARRFSKVKYHGDFIFAFDYIEDREIIEKKLKLWKRYSTKTTKLYVLCAYESQDAQDIRNTFERIKILMKYGCLPYIMRYEDYNDSEYKGMYVQLARWCNQPNFFKKKSFRQFCIANQEYHKNPDTNCAAYQAMIDFEKKHPDVASEYFDLRFDEINEYNNSFGYGRKYAHKNDCELCRTEQKMWLNAYHGVYDEHLVVKNYFIQEMDLQCLTYGTGDCNEIENEVISDWFIKVLLRTPIEEILNLIKDENIENILPSNIPQFSKFNDAVLETVNILSNMKDGIRYEQLGYYLDGKNKSDVAKKKYGENHSKFAALIDLAIIYKKNNVSLIKSSVLAKSYQKCTDSEKLDLVLKLLFRIPIVQHVLISAMKDKVEILNYMLMLSEKTLKRRRTNIEEIFTYIKENSNNDLNEIFANILEV